MFINVYLSRHSKELESVERLLDAERAEHAASKQVAEELRTELSSKSGRIVDLERQVNEGVSSMQGMQLELNTAVDTIATERTRADGADAKVVEMTAKAREHHHHNHLPATMFFSHLRMLISHCKIQD